MQISNFLVHLAALKSFFQFKFTTLYTLSKKDIALIFLYLTSMAFSEVAAFLQTAGIHYISNIF